MYHYSDDDDDDDDDDHVAVQRSRRALQVLHGRESAGRSTVHHRPTEPADHPRQDDGRRTRTDAELRGGRGHRSAVYTWRPRPVR